MSKSGITIEVEDIDFDFDSLIKQLDILLRSEIEVGILDTESDKILMIATVNEFGIKIKITDKMRAFLRATGFPVSNSLQHITVPERSYIRRTAEKKRVKIQAFIGKQLDLVLDGKTTADTALNAIGEFCVLETKLTMVEVKKPKNHPYTLEHKTGSNPLIDTGTLVSKINYRITTVSSRFSKGVI